MIQITLTEYVSVSMLAWAGLVGTLIFFALWLAARADARNSRRTIKNMIEWQADSSKRDQLESDMETVRRWRVGGRS